MDDHDLLIRIETKLDIFVHDVSTLKDRVTSLERDRDRQSGFFSGGKMVWGVLTAVPTSVIAFIIGGK